jgi:hypothetical protein
MANNLTRLMEMEAWDDVIKVSNEIVKKWDGENVLGTNEFETLSLVFLKEGKKQGLKDFLDLLEQKASK